MTKTYSSYQELVTSGGHEIAAHCDLFRFTEFYRSVGIECKILDVVAGKRESFGHIYQIQLIKDFMGPEEHQTTSEKFYGYSDFYTEIHFDKSGKFMRQGFFE